MHNLGIALILVVLWLLTQFVLIPYIKLQVRRKASSTHPPQPEEIWVQDDQIIYIASINPTGVELMTFDPATRQFHRWKDTWAEWQTRLRIRNVWFTGERRPLGDK